MLDQTVKYRLPEGKMLVSNTNHIYSFDSKSFKSFALSPCFLAYAAMSSITCLLHVSLRPCYERNPGFKPCEINFLFPADRADLRRRIFCQERRRGRKRAPILMNRRFHTGDVKDCDNCLVKKTWQMIFATLTLALP